MKISYLKTILILLAILSIASAGKTTQNDYPARPVRIIVSFQAGGQTDFIARALTDRMKKYSPQPFVIENIIGGAGVKGIKEVINSKPDGYTLGIGTMGLMTIQTHITKPAIGHPEEYTPFINIIDDPVCLAVRNDSPWKGAKALISHAKANPGVVKIGDTGIGSVLHLATENLKARADIKITTVHFTGDEEGISALLKGELHALSQHCRLISSMVREGKIRVIGSYEDKRGTTCPDIPIFKEAGFDIVFGSYLFLMGPRDIPEPIALKIHDLAKRVIEDPDFIEKMRLKGYEISYQGADDLKKRLKSDYENNAKLIEPFRLTK